MIISIKGDIKRKKYRNLINFLLQRADVISIIGNHDYHCSKEIIEDIFLETKTFVENERLKVRQTIEKYFKSIGRYASEEFYNALEIVEEQHMKNLQTLAQIKKADQALIESNKVESFPNIEFKVMVDEALAQKEITHTIDNVFSTSLLDIYYLNITDKIAEYLLSQTSFLKAFKFKDRHYSGLTFYNNKMGFFSKYFDNKTILYSCNSKEDYEEFCSLKISHKILGDVNENE